MLKDLLECKVPRKKVLRQTDALACLVHQGANKLAARGSVISGHQFLKRPVLYGLADKIVHAVANHDRISDQGFGLGARGYDRTQDSAIKTFAIIAAVKRIVNPIGRREQQRKRIVTVPTAGRIRFLEREAGACLATAAGELFTCRNKTLNPLQDRLERSFKRSLELRIINRKDAIRNDADIMPALLLDKLVDLVLVELADASQHLLERALGKRLKRIRHRIMRPNGSRSTLWRHLECLL